MKFSTYRRILDKVKDYAFFVRLYNWGEPFLNKDILKIIKYTKKNNIGVIISSNFNIVTDKIIKYLIKLEVDKIIISLDGVDQKSYESYRRGGNFQLVIENVKKIIKKRNELNSRKPDIIWQYLINKKNEKFVSNAKSMAKSIGVKISFPKFQISQEIVKTGDVINYSLVNEWIPDRLTKNPANYLFVTKPPCYFLYRTMVINPDGTVMPCCAVYDPKYNFGNILEDSLEGVWNNSYFLSARSIFSNKNFDNKKTTICDSCLSTWGMKYIKNIKFENV
jgi:radical SAM protein with 4Fe4S-binding SPASM domain